MSGHPLARPPLNVSKEAQKQATEDERIRNAIEGKFGFFLTWYAKSIAKSVKEIEKICQNINQVLVRLDRQG